MKKYNQAGFAATIHDIVPSVIREITNTTGPVHMPEEWFEAGRQATAVAPHVGVMADNSNIDYELYRDRLIELVNVAQTFVANECGEVGVALFQEEVSKRLTHYAIMQE